MKYQKQTLMLKWQKMQLLQLLYVEIQPVIKFLNSGSRIAALRHRTYFWLPTHWAMVQYGLELIRWRANIRTYRNSWVFHQISFHLLLFLSVNLLRKKKAINHIWRIEFILIHGKIFRSPLLKGELRISIEHTCLNVSPEHSCTYNLNPRMHSLNSS